MLEKAKQFYRDHEPACTVAFFVVGFLFDTLAVGRIDRFHNILHQAIYLGLCAFFISLEIRELHGAFAPPRRLATAWLYHSGATHFMLGTLLNIYTLFYFKSASLSASFFFLLILAGLLAVNELRPFENSAVTMRMALFSLCLISYFTYLVPMLVGSIGILPFLGSILFAAAAVAGLVWYLRRHLPEHPHVIFKHVQLPFAAVALGFSILYFAKLIPPVPLSISSIGIYHDAARDGDEYVLTMTRPRWKFWQKGDQSFAARPGDKIHCFVSVFSPARFKERLQVRWLFKDPVSGWQESDVLPFEISGGRDGGFRGVTVKSRYQPGLWRVSVQTSDQRELGRIDFTVAEDPSGGGPPRTIRL